ncbi:hypothetical protein RUM44_002122 [Polyplax serrata]|uniref:Uncharacterized protein n=1 Tax=Polyplax serrata TaxID=468196 RepID=A0ABR1AM32_POLSC
MAGGLAYLASRRGSRDSVASAVSQLSNEDIGPLNFNATPRGRQRRTSNFLELPEVSNQKEKLSNARNKRAAQLKKRPEILMTVTDNFKGLDPKINSHRQEQFWFSLCRKRSRGTTRTQSVTKLTQHTLSSDVEGKREDETVKNKIIDLGEDEGKMNADKAEGENKRNQKNHGE